MKSETTGINKKAEKKIRNSIEQDERLIAAIAGYQYSDLSNSLISFGKPPFDLNTVYFVGLTTKNLILREENVFGKVRKIEHIPLTSRKWADMTPDRKLDKLTLFWGEDKSLDLLIFSQLREQTQIFTEVFCVSQEPPRNYEPSYFHSLNYQPLGYRSTFFDKSGLSTEVLLIMIIGSGLLFAYLASLMTRYFYSDNPPDAIGKFVLVIMFVIWGFAGLVIAKRQENPGFLTIRGKLAKFSGLAITIVTWGFALWTLIIIFAR